MNRRMIPAAAAVVPSSRRRAIRLRAPAHLGASLGPTRQVLSVLDISEGGLAALTDRPMAEGSAHTLSLSIAGARTVVIRAEVAHCQLVEGRGSHSIYRTGFRFCGRPKPGTGSIDALIDCILAPALTVA